MGFSVLFINQMFGIYNVLYFLTIEFFLYKYNRYDGFSDGKPLVCPLLSLKRAVFVCERKNKPRSDY